MIKKLFLLAFIVTLWARPCLGQKEKESYKKNLSSRASAQQLLNEAATLKNTNPDAALDQVRQALAISVAQGDEFNEGRAYILLAEVNEGFWSGSWPTRTTYAHELSWQRALMLPSILPP